MRIGLVLTGRHLHGPLAPRDRVVKAWAQGSAHEFVLIHNAVTPSIRRRLKGEPFMDRAGAIRILPVPLKLAGYMRYGFVSKTYARLLKRTAQADRLNALVWLNEDWSPGADHGGADPRQGIAATRIHAGGGLHVVYVSEEFQGRELFGGDAFSKVERPASFSKAILDIDSSPESLTDRLLGHLTGDRSPLDVIAVVTVGARAKVLADIVAGTVWSDRVQTFSIEDYDRSLSALRQSEEIVVVGSEAKMGTESSLEAARDLLREKFLEEFSSLMDAAIGSRT